MALPLNFEAEALNPAPVPDLSGFMPDPWAFLEFVNPIDDAEALAFQVSALTIGMGELLRMIRELQQERTDCHERSQ